MAGPRAGRRRRSARPRSAAARRRGLRPRRRPARCTTPPGASCARLGSRVSAPTPARRAARHRRCPTASRRSPTLVSEGRSNKQVAATLYLSEKTIENALTHDLRQARRPLTRRAEPPLPPRRSSGGRAGRGRRASWRRAGRPAKTSPCAAIAPSASAAGVSSVRVRTTSLAEAPASARAARTISQQRRAWSAVDSGQPPSGMTGPVPETRTRSPARTAREKPITGSYGEPEAIRWRSGIGVQHVQRALEVALADEHVVGVVGRDREDRDAGLGERRRRARRARRSPRTGSARGPPARASPPRPACRAGPPPAGTRSTARRACG